jgi:hypothetical protein
VTSDDLDRVERELGIRLPSEYRALVLTYPVGLGTAGPDTQLLDLPEQLIAINRSLRSHGFSGEAWPAHFFTFGGDGHGNHYYLDVRREPSPVYFADHRGTLHSGQWPSLESWLKDQLRERAEGEAEESRQRAPDSAKRWWQFWI